VPAVPGSVYELALTHRSFAFERAEPIPHNERLELLGDAILGAVVTDFIYRSYPTLAEGELARLRSSVVSTQALAGLARELGLGEHIRLGRGEETSGGRDKASLLADTLEALIGAAYLDLGMERLAPSLIALLEDRIELAVAGGGHDPKTALQEAVVRRLAIRPSYRVVSAGPDHAKTFTAEVYLGAELYGEGAGRSKKEAEQNAAQEALALLAERPPGNGDQDARAS
jgi:ribonuclease III